MNTVSKIPTPPALPAPFPSDPPPPTLTTLPIYLIYEVLAYLNSQELSTKLVHVSKQIKELSISNYIFKPILKALLASKCESYRNINIKRPKLSYWNIYILYVQDGKRRIITREELTSISWDFTFGFSPLTSYSSTFNFSPSNRCKNHPNNLTYSWRLVTEYNSQERMNVSYVVIEDYPPFMLCRRDDWGWGGYNPNVILFSNEKSDGEVSCDGLWENGDLISEGNAKGGKDDDELRNLELFMNRKQDETFNLSDVNLNHHHVTSPKTENIKLYPIRNTAKDPDDHDDTDHDVDGRAVHRTTYPFPSLFEGFTNQNVEVALEPRIILRNGVLYLENERL